VIEVLLNILPVAVAKGAKAEPPAEKYNHLEELVEAVIPYPCAFARFAIGGKKIVTATCTFRSEHHMN
jgi:hypothetical protein